MSLPTNITPEQRKELLESARLARELKAQRLAEMNLQLDYGDDMKVWEILSKKHGVRLPQRNLHNSETKYIKRIATKLGVEISEYLEDCGVTTIKQLVRLNPKWTARAECGLFLEWYDERVI